MEIIYVRCAGIDVHKKTVVVCCITIDASGKKQIEIRTYSTTTAGLLAMSDWLSGMQITHVAMESTGEFWKPVYNILEGNFELLVANARHIKNVPGRKTDVKDAEWIAELLRHGLLRGSFIPPQEQRDLRDLTRQRSNLVQDRATVVNRLQKVLEWANLKLSSVATDVTGVSARSMLEAIIENKVDAKTLAELAKGRLRNKRSELESALTGIVREHHRFMLAQHLAQIDFLDEQVERFDQQIHEHMQQSDAPPEPPIPTDTDEQSTSGATEPLVTNAPATSTLSWQQAIELVDTIPGISLRAAEMILAETGIDMRRFASEEHFSSWAKVSPGNNESAGKRYSGSAGHGNRWLRTVLVQSAWAAVRVKNSYLNTFYHRLAARQGKKRAIFAVAHRILIALYHMLKKQEPFKDLGAAYLDERNKPKLLNRMKHRIEQLGFRVVLEPILPAIQFTA